MLSLKEREKRSILSPFISTIQKSKAINEKCFPIKRERKEVFSLHIYYPKIESYK